MKHELELQAPPTGKMLFKLTILGCLLLAGAYGFLVLERCLFPPAPGSPPLRAVDLRLRLPRMQPNYTPRGAAGKNRKA